MALPTTTVLITNYNYAGFVGKAVESVWAQTKSVDQIVIVDDGSTDGSAEIISRLAQSDRRIEPLLKENGGQASALNAGFSRVRGDLVVLLDADDLLLADLVERVVQAFETQPSLALLHYKLEVIDGDGRLSGHTLPRRPLSAGAIQHQLLNHASHVTPPTSGNTLPRWVLDRLLPVPESTYRISADRYLTEMAPLLGPVHALASPGACYRAHGRNAYDSSSFVGSGELQFVSERLLARMRQSLARSNDTRTHQLGLAAALGLPLPKNKRPVGRKSGLFRLISLKLDPRGHPFPEDGVWRALGDALHGALDRRANPGSPLVERIVYAGWLMAVAAAPRPLARRLVQEYYVPVPKSPFGRLARRVLSRVRRTSETRSVVAPAHDH